MPLPMVSAVPVPVLVPVLVVRCLHKKFAGVLVVMVIVPAEALWRGRKLLAPLLLPPKGRLVIDRIMMVKVDLQGTFGPHATPVPRVVVAHCCPADGLAWLGLACLAGWLAGRCPCCVPLLLSVGTSTAFGGSVR